MDGKPPKVRVVLKIQFGNMHPQRQGIPWVTVTLNPEIFPGPMKNPRRTFPAPTRSEDAKARGGRRGHRIGASAVNRLKRWTAVKVALTERSDYPEASVRPDLGHIFGPGSFDNLPLAQAKQPAPSQIMAWTRPVASPLRRP